jgi:hypothetical protein
MSTVQRLCSSLPAWYSSLCLYIIIQYKSTTDRVVPILNNTSKVKEHRNKREKVFTEEKYLHIEQ